MYKRFRAVIQRTSLIAEGDSVLAAVSGGLDSMVLAHLLTALRRDISFQLALAHVNYQLRGGESDAQEKLVRDFAKRHGLECFAAKTEGKVSQAAAREFRYHFFNETALQIGAGKIAVAHTKDDQVETILAQLLRGTSLRGLGGMAAVRECHSCASRNPVSLQDSRLRGNDRIALFRPLLSFSKEALKRYARENKVPYLEDSSNDSPKYWRNRIRHELLPVLQNLRPRALEKIEAFGREMRELSGFLETLAKDWLAEYARSSDGEIWLPRPRWLTLPKPLCFEILVQAYALLKGDTRRLKRDHLVRCESIASGVKRDGSYALPAGFHFIRCGDDLTFGHKCVMGESTLASNASERGRREPL